MTEPESVERFEFLVEGHELSFEGAMTPGRMVRVLEKVRWALGRKGSPIFEGFRGGVLRAQTLELVGDVGRNDTLAVEVWLSKVGRTSLEFSHRLSRGDGAVIGRASCTIVAIGDAGPAPLPDSVRALVSGESAIAQPPLEPPDPEKSYVREVRIRPSDLDLFRHMNQARYVDFLDDTRLLAHLDGHEAGFAEKLGLAAVSYEDELKIGVTIEALLERREDGTRRFGIRRKGEDRFVTKGLALPRRAPTE